jgi:hypothetical protein
LTPSRHTGGRFTISGTNLAVTAGDDVTILFIGPLELLGTEEEQSLL